MFADKLAYGALDAAAIVPPLAIAIYARHCAARAEKLILPYMLRASRRQYGDARQAALRTRSKPLARP